MEIVPFAQEHLEAAAALLAARHRADRARTPARSVRFESPADALRELYAAWHEPHTSGVAASVDDQLTAFLLGSITLPDPLSESADFVRPRSVVVGYAGHAVAPEARAATHGALYAAAAPRWLALGAFSHYVQLPATDDAALDAWWSLGFGAESLHAARPTDAPVAGSSRADAFSIRRGTREDLGVILEMIDALEQHHAAAPRFRPYNALRQSRRGLEQRRGIAETDVAYSLAEQRGQVVALQRLQPSDRGMDRPERCIHLNEAYTRPEARGSGAGTALPRHALAWAHDAGYVQCLVDWVTPNLSADAFWHARGFVPLSIWLVRHVDRRVAWAGDESERRAMV